MRVLSAMVSTSRVEDLGSPSIVWRAADEPTLTSVRWNNTRGRRESKRWSCAFSMHTWCKLWKEKEERGRERGRIDILLFSLPLFTVDRERRRRFDLCIDRLRATRKRWTFVDEARYFVRLDAVQSSRGEHVRMSFTRPLNGRKNERMYERSRTQRSLSRYDRQNNAGRMGSSSGE